MARDVALGKQPRILLRNRGYLRWLLVAHCSNLPGLMSAMAFVLVGQYLTHSNAIGGLLVMTYVGCEGVLSPVLSRLIDRREVRRGVLNALAAACLSLVGLSVAIAVHAPLPVVFVLAGLSGVCTAGVGGGLRSLLNRVVPEESLASAIALSSVCGEFAVVVAPLLVVAAAAISAVATVVAMAFVTAVALVAAFTLPRESAPNLNETPQHQQQTSTNTLWRNPRFVYWVVLSVAFGCAFGTTESGIVPLVQQFRMQTWVAALLLDALSAACILGGLVYAFFSHHLKTGWRRQSVVYLCVVVVACFAMSASNGWLTAAIPMIFFGVVTAPLNTVRSVAAQVEIPPNRQSEGFSSIGLAHSIGYAAGGALLAVLPLRGIFLASGILGAVVLLISPWLRRGKGVQEGEAGVVL